MRFGYADTPLGQLHYAESGSGGIPLICLHQTPRSSDEFAELLPLVGQHHRVIAMDMYGFGQSAKPEGPQTIEQYAQGVLRLADALGLERFAVMGHHTGAVVAVEVAAAAAHRVKAVVLSSPAWTGPEFRAGQARAGLDAAETRGSVATSSRGGASGTRATLRAVPTCSTGSSGTRSRQGSTRSRDTSPAPATSWRTGLGCVAAPC